MTTLRAYKNYFTTFSITVLISMNPMIGNYKVCIFYHVVTSIKVQQCFQYYEIDFHQHDWSVDIRIDSRIVIYAF